MARKPHPQPAEQAQRAAIYTRVSADDQVRNGYGLDVQEQQARQYAGAFGLQVVAHYSDPGISGTKPAKDRPGLAAALEAAKAGSYDVLIIPAIDRLARLASLLLVLWDELEQAGVSIVAVKERIDTSTAAGKLMRTMFAGVAEFERDSIVARTTAGRNARGLVDGEKGGALPYGYTRTEAGPQVDEPAAETVRHILRHKRGGKSFHKIAAELNAAGVPGPRGGRWYARTVKIIVDHKAIYAGAQRGASVERWPALV